MLRIQPLARLVRDDLRRLVTGYVAKAKYGIRKSESATEFALALELVPLPSPYRKRYDHLDAETLDDYDRVVSLGFSFGVYEEEKCVGLALAEPRSWNRSLWVRELHVAETQRQRGIGQQLIQALVAKAGEASLRILVCETQNTNVPAIRFYRKLGFHIEGIDLSYYSNEDFPDGEVAVFLKRRIGPQG